MDTNEIQPGARLLHTISDRAFWDIDFEKLDFEKHSDHIILRIFDYGKWNDIIFIIAYYGNNKVINTLLYAEHLTDRGHHFASAIFKIDKSKFKCYTNKQFRPSLKKH